MRSYFLLFLTIWLSSYGVNASRTKNLLKINRPLIRRLLVKQPIVFLTIPDCSLYTDGAFLPDPSSCSSYYMCVNGKAVQRTCASGLLFDSTKYICNLAALVNCDLDDDDDSDPTPSPLATETTTETTTTTTTIKRIIRPYRHYHYSYPPCYTTPCPPPCYTTPCPPPCYTTPCPPLCYTTPCPPPCYTTPCPPPCYTTPCYTTPCPSPCYTTPCYTTPCPPPCYTTPCAPPCLSTPCPQIPCMSTPCAQPPCTTLCPPLPCTTPCPPLPCTTICSPLPCTTPCPQLPCTSARPQPCSESPYPQLPYIAPPCTEAPYIVYPYIPLYQPIPFTSPCPPPCTTPCPPAPCTTKDSGTSSTKLKPEKQKIRILRNSRDCATLTDGTFLLHPKHCQRYYVCRNHRVHCLRCSSGQWFDYEAQKCLPKGDVHNCPAQYN